MKPDKKIRNKKGEREFHRIEQKAPWRRFCAATPYLNDVIIRERILCLIQNALKDDPFAADIHYHKKCWDRYVSNVNRLKCHQA